MITLEMLFLAVVGDFALCCLFLLVSSAIWAIYCCFRPFTTNAVAMSLLVAVVLIAMAAALMSNLDMDDAEEGGRVVPGIKSYLGERIFDWPSHRKGGDYA